MRLTPEGARAFVRERGVVLASAKGSAASLVEAIVGEPINGSWWAHPEGKHIYATLRAVAESEDVLVCRLVGGKLTLVHRRLWPALARLAGRFSPDQISRVREEHTASGRHASHAIPFQEWVPHAVMQQASELSEQEALAALGAWLPSFDSPARVRRPRTSARKDLPMITGSCLCGAVRIEIDEPLEKAPEACHCTQCRKQTGNFFVGVNVRRTALRVLGEERIAWYQSSEKVQRGFCSICGSVLFWKPTIDGYEWTGVTLGCLDTSMKFKISKHTFVANKGSYYEIQDDAPQREAY